MRAVVQHFDLMVEVVDGRVIIAFKIDDGHAAIGLRQADHLAEGTIHVGKMVCREAGEDQIKRGRWERNGLSERLHGLDSHAAFGGELPRLFKHVRRWIECDDTRSGARKRKGRVPGSASHIA